MAKGVGNLHLKFTSDIEKASRDIDKLIVKVERLGAVAKEQKAKIAASTAPSIPMTDYGQQWGKSFGSFGMGGMTHLGGSPLGPNPRAMVEARATEQVAKRMSIFSRIMGGVNEKTLRFMGSMGVVNPQIGMMATKFGLLGAAVMGLIGIVKHVVGQIAHFGNIIEQSRIVLKSIYGSDRKAVETIRGMREFSRKTHHTPEEVVGATTMLAKYGLDPFKKGTHGLAADKHVMNLMSGLAAMPGMGGKPIGLDRAINAAIAGRDVRPLKALGPEAIAAYEKARQAGMSGTPEYVRVMVEELAKVPKIMALANEQADTMATMWSTITGYAEEFWMDLTGAGEETGVVTLWSQLKEILKDIRDGGERFITYIGPYVTELGAFLGGVLKYVWGLFKLIWDIVGPVLVPAFKIIIQLFRIVWEIGKGFMTTFIQLGKILFEIGSIPIRIMNAIFGIDSKVESITQKLMKFVLGLQITFMFVQIFLDGVIQSISKGVDYIISKFQDFISLFTDFYKKYEPYINAFVKGVALSTPLSGFVPAMEISSRVRSDAQARKSLKNSENIEAGRAGITVKSGDTIINNYETQRTDIEKVKNMSGSVKTQADKYRTGMPR